MARFYSNENIALQVVVELTNNRRHFLQLHLRRTERHSGIILCTLDADFAGQANRIDAAVTVLPDCADQSIRIKRPA